MIKNKFLLISLLLLLIYCICPVIKAATKAEEINFSQAVKIALENSASIKDIRQEIEAQQRAIQLTESGQDFQIDLSYDSYEDDNSLSYYDETIGLDIEKDYSFGLSIGPSIKLDADNYSSYYTVEISQTLLPWLPTDSGQELYAEKKELEKLEAELESSKTDKLIEWIDFYLELTRLQEQKLLYKEKLALAEKELAKTQAECDIDEASNLELMEAQIALKEAKYEYENVSTSFDESKEDLYIELGLAEDTRLLLSDEDSFLTDLKNRSSSLTYYDMEAENLLNQAATNDYDLKSNLIENEKLDQQLEWVEKERDTDLSLIGDYDSEENDFTVGISLTHTLYDGGQHQIEVDGKKADIADVKDEYQTLLKKLKLELKEKQTDIVLNQDQLRQSDLTYQRSTLNKEIAREQLDRGAITKLDFEDYVISEKEAEIDLAADKDDLFISRLEIVALVEDNSFFLQNYISED